MESTTRAPTDLGGGSPSQLRLVQGRLGTLWPLGGCPWNSGPWSRRKGDAAWAEGDLNAARDVSPS